MKALGRLYDIAPVISPIDGASGALSGKYVSVKNSTGVTFVLFKDAGTAGDDPVLTLQEATDAAGTGAQNLAVIDEYFYKAETTLDNDEAWTRVTQTAAATIDLDGTANAEQEAIVAFHVDDAQLSDTYTHVTVNIADVGANAQFVSVLGIVDDLQVQRRPDSLAAPQ